MTHKPRFRTLTAAIALAAAAITATAGTPDFQLDLRGSFAGNGAEILSHDSSTGRVFVTNSNDNTVDVIDISDPDTPVLLLQIDVSPYGAGVTSVAASDGLIAAAIESASATTPGVIAVFDPDGNLLRIFGAGVLPDNVVFSPDGNYILSANEGEPNGTDPRGSVTVIDLTEGLDKATAQLAD
ncbi:MAG: alkaline phosphatase, partial [Pseudomonadota bacterium]